MERTALRFTSNRAFVILLNQHFSPLPSSPFPARPVSSLCSSTFPVFCSNICSLPPAGGNLHLHYAATRLRTNPVSYLRMYKKVETLSTSSCSTSGTYATRPYRYPIKGLDSLYPLFFLLFPQDTYRLIPALGLQELDKPLFRINSFHNPVDNSFTLSAPFSDTTAIKPEPPDWEGARGPAWWFMCAASPPKSNIPERITRETADNAAAQRPWLHTSYPYLR